MRKTLIILILIVLDLQGRAQTRVGEWQDHLSFSQAICLVEARGIIYCATRSGLFSYNPVSTEISKWSKVNGLSDLEIACMEYSVDHNTLIIAYANSNIDLLRNNSIINIPDIKQKSMTGSKKINSMQVQGDDAILSCGFGIIRINLVRDEVASTYFIGPNGTQLNVFETVLFNYDSIFAATEKGVYKAWIDDPSLENYLAWKPVAGQPFRGQTFNHLAYNDGMLWASHLSPTGDKDSIFTYDGYNWAWFPRYYNDIRRMRFIDGQLCVVSSYQINLIAPDGKLIRNIDHYGDDLVNPNDFILDKDLKPWIADREFGLIYSPDYQVFEKIRPAGPWDRKTFDMAISDGDLWIAGGAYDGSWNNIWNISGVSAKINGTWQVFNPMTVPQIGSIRDIVRLAVDPADPHHVYGASWGYGVVEFKDGQYVGLYDDTNTGGALASVFPGNPYIRIGGMAFDSKQNLWVTNSSVPSPVSVKKPDGTWKSFPYGQYMSDAFTGQIVVTPGDVKWIQLPKGNGLFAFDNGRDLDDESDDRAVRMPLRVGIPPKNTIKILNDIYSMAADLDGRLWIGTSSGAVVYYAPSAVFTSTDFYASQPSVDQGDSLYHGLLSTEIVTAIAVDGANRKWFGTRNSGVFLTNPDGTEMIESFNITNSPLLSNEIVSIVIDNQSGEVYFGTEGGVVSYRGTATRDDLYTGPVYAFPNPVRPGYSGPITVKGVPAGSVIKITDLTGNMVFEGESQGGQVVWNGNERSGKPVVSGVYLVFASTPDLAGKAVSKILIVR
jgi:ligand-binding sensor domain-containing protein